MSHQLTFNRLHEYDAGDVGISVPVVLSVGGQSVGFPAKIDTGATFCVFKRGYGEMLGITIESGEKEQIGTVTGLFTAYGHELTLKVLDLEFNSVVYFAADDSFNRNVLGRRGWLNRVRLGIIDYDGKLFVSKYEDEIW